MLAGSISDLAKSIAEATVPQWLLEYITKNRDKIRAELALFGRHEIPMPDGGKIILQCSKGQPEAAEGGPVND
jgi:hypothetical protein